MDIDKTKKRNILIVHNYYQIPGGEDTVVENEKKMLEDHGHRVVLYTRNNAELNDMSKLKKMVLPITTIFNPRTYQEIKKIIKKENIEIVHVHNTLNLISPSVYYAAYVMNVPVVQTMHNFRLLCPGATFYRDNMICKECVYKGLICAIKHRCYRKSVIQTLACVINTVIHRWTNIYSKINFICLTEFNKEQLLLLNLKKQVVDPNKIYIKPNFTYTGIQHKENKYYLFIGRIEKIKGIDILIEAFKSMPQLQLKIVGTGNELSNYKRETKKYKNIEFLGYLNRDEINKSISMAKAVVVTSQWYETFGMIIIEAYANSVPVIVGDIGNIGTLVDEKITGLKFKYNSYESLKKAIIMFENSDAISWGTNALKKYMNEFSVEINEEKMESIYEDVLENK